MPGSLSTAVNNPVDGAEKPPIAEAEKAATDLWTRAAERLRARLSRHTFQTYFDPIRPVALTGDQLTLAHSSKFMIDWVRDNLLDVLLQDLEAQRGKPCTVTFVVRERPAGDAGGEAAPPAGSAATISPAASSPVTQTDASASSSRPLTINPKYTFD